MGVDFVALLKHALDVYAIQSLPSALTPMAAPGLARAVAALGQLDASNHPLAEGQLFWRINEAEMISTDPAVVWEGGPFALIGPYGLTLDIFRHTCEVSDGTRWRAFLTDPKRQNALRRCCYELARILGSPSAIYVPDDAGVALWDGVPFERIPAWLHNRFGYPAITLTTGTAASPEIYSATKDWHGGVYYIDTLTDPMLVS